MKIFKWIWDNILFICTLFLLVFIPLYPKKPLIDIVNTWVYIRAEDFIVVFILLIWAILLLRKKITLKTPLTIPIIIFWIVGAIATIHAVLLIFPEIPNVFPNVAFLSMLRRIEYMSVFFIAYTGMKDKGFLKYVIAVLAGTLICVSLYGFGQKYLDFPAYLTMNEEFAKGIPIQISALARIPSTFAGHYDFAAYLVLIIPILTSMVFGVRNTLIRLSLLAAVGLGFIMLFMTVSRVSFFVLLISLAFVAFLQKKKLILLSLPVLGVVLAVLFISLTPRLLDRFGSTIKEIDILVNANTGEVIGETKQASASLFENKTIMASQYVKSDDIKIVDTDFSKASPSALRPFYTLPPKVVMVIPPNTSTGENLPQGTGYINLPLSPVTRKLGEFFYEKPKSSENVGTASAMAFVFYGDFLVKRAAAYDLSFTTRFQGEWPHALDAFRRNILFGSGYSSVSLAVDNDYLRMLGEIGLLGFASFLAIFLALGIYIKKILPQIDSPVARSFVVGFAAGVIGLALNALLIDVFEASKVAFLLWLLMGVTVGVLHFYQKEQVDLYKELKKIITSKYAIIVYLGIVAVMVYSPMISNFFVGDDFTWLRWAAECKNNCIWQYFTQSDGFFYRPGTKVYFLLMYSLFWLNQTVYHVVSILLHFIVVVLLFLLAKKILRDFSLAVLSTFIFLILSGYSEMVFWVSATGYLFNAAFILLSLFFFIQWNEKKKMIYFILCMSSFILSLLFHELGVIVPILLVAYKFISDGRSTIKQMQKQLNYYVIFIVILLFYVAVRNFSGSHWFSGDYSYNILKLPFNVVGNGIGYLLLALFGPASLSFYETFRDFFRENLVIAGMISLIVLAGCFYAYRFFVKRTGKEDKKVILFCVLFFVITLLPFLGLGNITSRYSYLASFGVIVFFVFFMKKLYNYLRSSGKETAFSVVVVIISVFSLLHIIQQQQLHSDWYEAGLKVNKFFTAIDSLYTDNWSKDALKFHFVNVPLRVGEAWVFPVGLKDALWFVYRNPNIAVYQDSSLRSAFNVVTAGSPTEKVFVFQDDGRAIEKPKPVNYK